MMDPFTAWRRMTDDILWQAGEPITTEAEARRLYETGKSPQTCASVLMEEDRERDGECSP